ncbi:MAG: hypothetical protein AAF296_03015 [Pseudomonadota bacterium]
MSSNLEALRTTQHRAIRGMCMGLFNAAIAVGWLWLGRGAAFALLGDESVNWDTGPAIAMSVICFVFFVGSTMAALRRFLEAASYRSRHGSFRQSENKNAPQ